MFEAPSEEFGDFLIGRLGSLLAQDLPGAARNRPGVRASVISQNDVEVLRLVEINVGSGILKALEARAHDLAIAIDHAGIGHLVFENVSIFNVTDGAGNALHISCHTLVALTAYPGGPVQRGVGTDFLFPLRADLGEVVSKSERGTGTVRAVHHGDIHAGELEAGVELFDRRIIPLLDLAKIDVSNDGAAKNQLTRLNARQVVHQVFACNRRRELNQSIFFQFFRFEGHIAGAKRHRAGLDLSNTATRPDALIVDLGASLFLIDDGPFHHQGVHPGAARASQAGSGKSRGHDAGAQCTRDGNGQRSLAKRSTIPVHVSFSL